MLYFEDIPKRLVREFNKANNTALTVDSVDFVDPRPVTSLSPKPNTTCNTAISMQLKANQIYTGETTLYYDRLDLGATFKHAPLGTLLPIKASKATGTHDLLDELSIRLGARLSKADFYNDPMTVTMGVSPLTIRAKPGSLLWTGSLTILTWHFDSDTDILVDYPGKQWTYSDALADINNKINGKYVISHYCYNFDYTTQAAVLKTVPASPGVTPVYLTSLTLLNNLQAALVAVDSQDWVVKTSYTTAGYNLYHCWALYNGPTDQWLNQFDLYPGFGGPTMNEAYKKFNTLFSTEYDNVLVIQLDTPAMSSVGWPCYAIFHYNDF